MKYYKCPLCAREVWGRDDCKYLYCACCMEEMVELKDLVGKDE